MHQPARRAAARTLLPVRRIRAAAARHPQLGDAVLVALLAGVLARVTASFGGTTAEGWVWFAALHLPLVWRRRWPAAVFWTVVCLALGAAGAGALGPALLIVPMVAGYTLARHRPRRYLWPVAAPLAVFVAGWLANGGPPWDAVALLGLFAAAVMLGTNRRTHRAYLAALEDRARRLEREREQQARLVVADERARIAREMHDIVAHNLAVMVALTDGAAATTPVAPQRAVAMMEQASTTGREALTEIRRLVDLLRTGEPAARPPPVPPDLAGGRVPPPQPGFADVAGLVDQVRAAGLRVTLTCEGQPGRWGPGAGLAVYRIVQEALTNTIRHAGPRAGAQVFLRYHAAGADIDVLDDGGGAGTRPAPGGHGLTGMTERAMSYGGHLEAGPRPEGGWRVHAYLPLGGGP
jgi:signal transduction histidine kinase